MKFVDNPRKYGSAPFKIVVVHGGPGAAGEMKPVAERLSDICGILESMQTESTVEGQVAELSGMIRAHAETPSVLIGYSWGAWLSLVVAAVHPDLVGKLILVESGPFKEQYAGSILQTRLSRLSDDERKEWKELSLKLTDSSSESLDDLFKRFGELLSKADSYDPLPDDTEVDFRPDIFHSIWPEAAELRRSGELLQMASRVECPVAAIHGEHDPHPAEGVREPLSRVFEDFEFVMLEKCGHKPWVERHARERFFEILEARLRI